MKSHGGRREPAWSLVEVVQYSSDEQGPQILFTFESRGRLKPDDCDLTFEDKIHKVDAYSSSPLEYS